MKTAFLSEFASVRAMLLQSLGLYLIIGLVIGVSMGTAVGMAACIAAMTPFMMAFTFSAYDAMNGWERFRASLPVSRTALVASRYLNILASSLVMMALGSFLAIAFAHIAQALPFVDAETAAQLAKEAADPLTLVAAAAVGMTLILLVAFIMLPPILRFGMTKAMRIIPLLMVMCIPAAVWLLPEFLGDANLLANASAWLENPANMPLLIAGVFAFALIACAASFAVATMLYRDKEL